MRILSGPLRGKKWINASHNKSVWLGLYERKQTGVFVDSIKKSGVLWDLGAHVGYYTLLFLARRPEGFVYSFEPSERNSRILKEHMQLNEIRNYHLVECAVSDTDGVLKFKSGKTSVAGKLSQEGEISVPAVSLNRMYREGALRKPDVIKMDIEGAEAVVLKDISTVLEECSPILFLSTHGTKVHKECLQLLRALNYELKPVDHTSIDGAREVLAIRNVSSG